MVLNKILDQYVSSYQTGTKSMIGFGNNEVLKTLTKSVTLTLKSCMGVGMVLNKILDQYVSSYQYKPNPSKGLEIMRLKNFNMEVLSR